MKEEKKGQYRFLRLLVLLLPCTFLVVLIFHTWFGFTALSSGDWSYHFAEEVRGFSFIPVSWNSAWNGGLGRNAVFFAPLETYFRGTASLFINTFHLSWPLYERFVWYWLYLLVAAGGAIYLASFFVPLAIALVVAPIVFVTNTYALILTSGGQMGVAMAYAFAPWVVGYTIRKRRMLVTALLFAAQILLDPRIFYLTFFFLGGYMLLSGLSQRDSVKVTIDTLIRYIAVPLFIALGLHAWWIIPMLVYRNNPIGELGPAYNSLAALRFFSFTDFSHALALMHGNWPENVFGKTGFLQPEFLIIPLIAFAGFLFVRKRNKRWGKVETLGVLGLLGIFLTKGANEPFGFVYEWLFQHVPGFNVFRDSSKFFLIVVLSYTVLIAHSLAIFSETIGKQWGKVILFSLFFFFWIFTIRGTWMGVTKGTLVPHEIPGSYIELKDLILSDPHFSRSLWVPQVHRYAINTDMHPAMGAQEVFGVASQSAVLEKFLDPNYAPSTLSRWSVRYVVVPQDTQNELFLDDRKYSQKKRDDVVRTLNGITWLRHIPLTTHDIDVYESFPPSDHFEFEGLNGLGNDNIRIPVQWKKVNVATYTVSLPDFVSGSTLIFSESFDPGWTLRVSGKEIGSHKTNDRLNSFIIPSLEGNIEAVLMYNPHEILTKSLWVSGAVLVAVCFFLLAPLVQYK